MWISAVIQELKVMKSVGIIPVAPVSDRATYGSLAILTSASKTGELI